MNINTCHASDACECSFRLYRIFNGPCCETQCKCKMQPTIKQGYAIKYLCWPAEIWWTYIGHDFPSVQGKKPCHNLQLLSGTSSSKIAKTIWRTSPLLDGLKIKKRRSRAVCEWSAEFRTSVKCAHGRSWNRHW